MQHFKEFSKAFESLIYRHDVPTVFDDFLSLAISALSLGRAELLYQETIARYSPKEQPMFSKMFAAMIMAYEERSSTDGAWVDILGEFFEEHNGKFGRDARGQFFTPPTVCDFMARVTAADAEVEGHQTKTVNDCACGSGRNLIAHSRVNPRNRMTHFYVGQDIDHRCVKMTTINLAMYGLSGVVVHQDTLQMKTWGGYRVWLPETGLGIQPLTKEQALAHIVRNTDEGETIKEQPKPITVPRDVPVSTKPIVEQSQFKLF